MTFKRSTLLLAALACAAAFAGTASAADLPGHHPAYLRALSDLRDARWDLQHRAGDPAVSRQEDIAIQELDRAIAEATKAAARDGKNIDRRPPEDARLDRAGRLHHALDLLGRARQDIAQDETNPTVRAARDHAVEHLDHAIEATRHAIHDAEQHR